MLILRRAEKKDAEACYQCIEDEKEYHNKSMGSEQWPPGYPALQTIMETYIYIGAGNL